MASIWKDLMFLHGHFVRAEDLRDEPPATAAATRTPVATTRSETTPPVLAGTDLAGGCA